MAAPQRKMNAAELFGLAIALGIVALIIALPIAVIVLTADPPMSAKDRYAKEQAEEAQHQWNIAHGVDDSYVSPSCVAATEAHPELNHPCMEGKLDTDDQYIHDLAKDARTREEEGR